MTQKQLVLVDGAYYLFRAHYAMPSLTTSQDEPTSAIYGVVNMLRKLLREERPDYFAVVFDASGKSFRNELYPEYKAHRPPMPPELAVQIAPLHDIIRALGVPLLCIDNVEADDVIATLALAGAREGLKILISTGDKDLAQVVDDNIRLVNTMTNTRYDRDGVTAKFGVPPERMVDYLALVGDSSDNVPGIPKVGPKTAAKWLQQYGSLDAIVAAAAEIKGRVGELLRENLEQIPLSRRLVTLKTDLELPLAPQQLLITEQDKEALKRHYQRWGFRSWLPEINGTPPPRRAEESGAAPGCEIIHTAAQLEQWLPRLAAAELLALHTETSARDCMRDELVGLSFAAAPGAAAYLPLAHDYEGAPRQLSRRKALEKLRPLLEAEKPAKVGHDLKYDLNVLARHRVALGGIAHDVMLQSYVLDSAGSRHDLAGLASRHLGQAVARYEEVAGKGARQVPFNQVPIEQAAAYAVTAANVALQLHQALWSQLSQQEGLRRLYAELEIPLLSVLARMERRGVMIDAAMLQKQSAALAEQMRETERRAHRVAGAAFNIGSPGQIREILYEKMQLPVTEKTPKGQPSTAESVLQELAAEHELPALILQHRGLSKLKSTYTDRLPEQVNPADGRVHTSYHQAVAATGRLSSSDPNLQNIPIRTEEGRKIRQAFIAPAGSVLLAADYSQIELRIMAHLSGDETLLAAFAQGQDIHRATAAEVFSCGIDEVSFEQRRAAKAINFGLMYGMSAFGLARQLDTDRGTAQRYVEKYFERYPGVRRYMDTTREQARENGYVETAFQRRLYLPGLGDRNAARRRYAERTAINAPLQGTAADIIKRAMTAIDQELLGAGAELKMIMQVHDELVFEAAESQVQDCRREIIRLMEDAAELSVPLVVDVGVGANWDEAH